MTDRLVYWHSPARGRPVFGIDLGDHEVLIFSNCVREAMSRRHDGTMRYSQPGRSMKPQGTVTPLLTRLTEWGEEE